MISINSRFYGMYMKRLKAYKQIGYEIIGDLQADKQTVNAIYDGDNYSENYHKDLVDANKNIVISSSVISGLKVYELSNMLKEKQMSGIQVTIVTWTRIPMDLEMHLTGCNYMRIWGKLASILRR